MTADILKKLLALALLFIYFDSTAQTRSINGYVRDSITGETLPGTSVTWADERGVLTNSFGFFSLRLPAGAKALNFSFLGYESKTIEMTSGRDTTIVVRLSPASEQIEQVVVRSAAGHIVEYDNVGNASISAQQLKYTALSFGEVDILKTLQMLPGVSSGKDGSSGLNIRGGSSDQSLILLDDVPTYNQMHAFGVISIFGGDVVKSADLYKSFISPVYGGRLSGVASIRTRDGNKYEHSRTVVVGALASVLTLEGPIVKGKGSYLVSGRRFVPDLFLRGFYLTKPYKENKPMYTFYDVTAKAVYDIGLRNTVSFGFYMGEDFTTLTATMVERDPYTGLREKLSKTKSGIVWGNTTFSLGLQTAIRQNIFMNNTVYGSLLRNREFSEFKSYIEDYNSKSRNLSQMDEMGLKTHFEHQAGPRYIIDYGFDGSMQWFRPQNSTLKRNGRTSRSNYGEEKLATAAVYFNNNIRAGIYTINLGVRAGVYHNFSDTEYSIDPRASVTAAVGKKARVWASYIHTSQPVFSLEKHYFSLPIDYWTPFIDNILSSANQYSVGGNMKFLGMFDVTLEGYYKDMKDLILVQDSEDFYMHGEGYRMATGTAWGVELSTQFRRYRLGLNAGYAYSKSRRNSQGESFPFIFDTPHALNITGMYDILEKGDRKHTFSVNISYRTGLPYILANDKYAAAAEFDWRYTVSNHPIYPNTRLKDYFRADVNYTMEKKMRTGMRVWQISILNVTNHVNPYLVYMSQDTDDYKSLTIIPFMPSFSYKRTF